MSTAIDTTTSPVTAALSAVRAELRIPETYPHEAIADICGGEDSDLARAVYERLSRAVIADVLSEPRIGEHYLWGDAAEVVDSWLGDGSERCAEELDRLFARAETLPAPTERPEICDRCHGYTVLPSPDGDPQHEELCCDGYRLLPWTPWPAELDLHSYAIDASQRVIVDGRAVGERLAEDELGHWATSAATRSTTVAPDEPGMAQRLDEMWRSAWAEGSGQ